MMKLMVQMVSTAKELFFTLAALIFLFKHDSIKSEFVIIFFLILLKNQRFIKFLFQGGIALTAMTAGGPPSKRSHQSSQPAALHANAHVPGSVAGTPSTGLVGGVTQLVAPLNGRQGHAGLVPMSRSNARKQVMSWMDAPDDVYFRSTENIK